MSRLIGLFQSLSTDMGVDLGRRKTGMPKEGLHTAQIRTIIQQVCGKTVAQLVRADIDGQTGKSSVFLYDIGNPPGRDTRF